MHKLLKTFYIIALAALANADPVFGETNVVMNSSTHIISNQSNFISGNGIPGTQNRTIGDFYSLTVSSGVNVNYQRADTLKVEVTGDQNLLDNIQTEVVQGMLVVSTTESYRSQLPITVELSSPHLNEVNLSGAGRMIFHGLKEKSFNLIVSGSASVFAEGSVTHFSALLSGSCVVDAKNLQSNQADVSLTGSGSMVLSVKDTLKAGLTGSGKIQYFGHPKQIQPIVRGSGKIEPGS